MLSLSAGALFGQTSTFNFTGGMQTFTVPCGVDTVFVQTWGAEGGSGASGNSSSGPVAGGAGGLGGYAEGWLLVNPGDVLNVFVGGQGGTPTAGFNSGGTGGNQNSGGGGGASDVRVNGTAEADRVITAGGGGGGGRGGCEGSNGPAGAAGAGGAGGGGNGVNGAASSTSGGSAGGGFGAIGATGGGAGAGCGGFLGQPGGTATTATGANGGAGQSCCCFSFGSIPGGGGGGGGQVGGGGGGGGSAGTTGCSGNDKGAGGGGAGGTSYVGGVINGVTNSGIWLGNGQVTISWTSPVPPSHTITGTNTICLGASTNLSITADAYSTIYTWTVPSGLTLNSGQNTTGINITGTVAGTYMVYVMGVNVPCSLNGPMDSIAVTVNALPTIAATAGAAVCVGGSVQLDATGGTVYDWQPGSLTGTPVTVSPSSTTTYTLTGTDANGCTNSATTTAVINQLPTVTTNTSAIAVCNGDMVTLFGQGASSYTWTGGITDNVPFSATTTTTYTVTGTDANGCNDTATAIVTVNPLPNIGATALPSTTVCAGDTVVATGSGAVSYVWTGGVVDGVPFVPPTGVTSYTCTGTDANGCTGTFVGSLTANALPTVTATPADNSVCVADASQNLTGTPAGGTWSGPGVVGTTFNPATAGVGTAMLTYSYTDSITSCSNSATTSIVVSACVGIAEVEGFPGVTYMPNPATTTLQVRWDVSQVAVNTIEVRDITGRLISTQQATGNGSAEINVESLPAGNYNLVLISGTGKANYQFIKQ